MENCKIYSLNEPNSDIVRYIGFTQQTLSERLSKHLVDKTNPHKINWFNLLKRNNCLPKINLIEDGLTVEQAKKKEIEYIKLFKSVGAKLINKTFGGDGNHGYRHTPESKRKLSESHKGKPPWSKGLKMSKEYCDKLSAVHIGLQAKEKHPFWGKKRSAESVKKMADAHRGVKQSSETIKKRRDVLLITNRTPEFRDKMRQISLKSGAKPPILKGTESPHFGKRHSPERIEAHRKRMTGRKQSQQEIYNRGLVLKRGEDSNFSKLKATDILSIRKLYSEGMLGKNIAALFNVSPSNISQILLRKTWVHIQ